MTFDEFCWTNQVTTEEPVKLALKIMLLPIGFLVFLVVAVVALCVSPFLAWEAADDWVEQIFDRR